MGVDKGIWAKELQILFGALGDGLRQETRRRSLFQLVAPEEVEGLYWESEAHLKGCLAGYLNMVGFMTHLETHFSDPTSPRRPDLAVFLPASGRYVFLEFKVVNPQMGVSRALSDIAKLDKAANSYDRKNGLVCLGFRDRRKSLGDRFPSKYQKLSERIALEFPKYKAVRVGRIDFEGLDKEVEYGMLGLWVRKLS